MRDEIPPGIVSDNTAPKSMRQAIEEWAHRPKVYLSAEELAICQNEPVLAARVRGPELVACCECGYVEKKLDRHLWGTHHLRGKDYKQEWPGSDVLCHSLKERYTAQLKPVWTRPRELGRKAGRRLIGKSQLWKQKTRGGKAIPETRVAEAVLECGSFTEMSTPLGITVDQAKARGPLLERLGFPRHGRGRGSGGYLFEHGQPVTGSYIKDILEDFGLTQTGLGRDLKGVRHPKVLMSRWVRQGADIPLCVDTARKFVDYRRKLNHDLIIPIDARATGLEKTDRYKGQRRQRYLLRSEVRGIPQHYAILHPLLRELRDELRQERISEDGILAWICERSRKETAEKRDGPAYYRRLLFWWLELHGWLKEGPGVLVRLPASRATYDFLGFVYGTTRQSIEECVVGMIQPIDPALAREKTCAGRKKSGRPHGPSMEEHDKTYFDVGRAVEEAIPLFRRLIDCRHSLPRATREKRSRLERELAKEGFSPVQVAAGVSAKHAKAGARAFIAAERHLSLPAVKRYHLAYLAYLGDGPAGYRTQ